ncbi:MAG TPA: peptidoglycan DD-metalloendopeptidase family protein [Vicinamibacterales bacterium]
MTSLAAQAQPDRARTEALARRAGDRLVALQREADRLAADERSLLNELRTLEVERQIKTEELKQAETEVASLQADLDETAAKVEALQATEEAARPELRSRLVEIYKLGQARYTRLLLSTPDLRRIGQASRTVAALAQLDRDRIARHEQMLEDLDATRGTLEARKKTAVAARATAEQAHAAVQKATLAKSSLVRDIDSRRDLNAQVSSELQTAQVKLQAALRDSSNASAGEVPSLPLKPFKGDLVWPAAGQLRRRFGGTSGLAGGSSNGMEIGTDDGATISAVHDGVVAFAGTFSGFGNLIILDHGSQTFSLYGDLLDFSVARGARVDRGQPLGSAGPLPSGGTGLYFELRVDGHPVDPLQWLRKASQP